MGGTVERNDTDLMQTLVVDRHDSWRLQNLESVIVGLSDARHRAGDATGIYGMVRPRIVNRVLNRTNCDAPCRRFFYELVTCFLCLFCQWRFLAILWLQNQRCAARQPSLL